MESKNILIILSDTPMGKTYIDHILRCALGMSAGYKEHRISVLFTNDSVLFALIPLDHGSSAKLVKALRYLDASLYLDKVAIEDRNIDSELIEGPFRIMDRDSIRELLNKSHFTVSI